MPTVLVVDDEWAIADWLQAVISEVGYHVLVASNGKKALTLIESETVDLVIADYMMPVMDGPSLVAAMRVNPRSAKIPVVMMTAVLEHTVQDRIQGSSAYLRKPFRDVELFEVIRKILPLADP